MKERIIKVVNKNDIDFQESFAKKRKGKAVELVQAFSGAPNNGTFDGISAQTLEKSGMITFTDKYPSAFHMPFGDRPSIYDRIKKNAFSNKTPSDVADFVDAVRIEVTRRKEAIPLIRGFIYNVQSKPNAGKVVKANDLFPYGIVFEQNNGNGQSVEQGTWQSGNVDNIDIEIYAAGFKWTLAAELFNQIADMQKLSDATAVGYNAKADNNAIKPILDADYTGKTTPAATGNGYQENLYNTLRAGIRALGKRQDPVLKRKIDVSSGLVLLVNSTDALEILDIINGQLNDPADSKNLRALREIERIVIYNDEVIDIGLKSVTYSGVTDLKGYLIKPNPYFSICEKRGLTMEMGAKDVDTLSRESRAWYFAEGYYYAKGVATFVQELTFPNPDA
jgi:hypothetical protein